MTLWKLEPSALAAWMLAGPVGGTPSIAIWPPLGDHAGHSKKNGWLVDGDTCLVVPVATSVNCSACPASVLTPLH